MVLTAVAVPTIRPAETPEDVEAMRVIRNAGREFMTHHREEISPEQQAAWWAARDPTMRACVCERDGTVVGYGLLAQRSPGGAWWVSLAVAPEHRGQGYGVAIYRYLAERAPARAWAEIAEDNAASIRAAERAGYERTGSSTVNGTAVLLYRGPR